VDKDPRNGRFLLSGSNQPRIGSAVGDSLLGRAAYRTLRPLTLSELRFDERHPGWSFLFDPDERATLEELERRAAASGRLDWQDAVRTGGFPRAVVALEEHRLRILDDYIEVFSNRDIRELLAIETPARLEAFVRLVCARTGKELNATRMSSELGVPVTTIRRWLEALQRSYLVQLLPPYSPNAGTRVVKAPKIHLVDAALAIAGARESTPTGFHLENLVANDLLVWRDGSPTRDLFHWRSSAGPEVDFVLAENGALVPVEVKATTSVDRKAARHLRAFLERYGGVRALVASCDPDIRVLETGILACPWWAVI
jgi:predicted AAA+ superfamily ATPase